MSDVFAKALSIGLTIAKLGDMQDKIILPAYASGMRKEILSDILPTLQLLLSDEDEVLDIAHYGDFIRALRSLRFSIESQLNFDEVTNTKALGSIASDSSLFSLASGLYNGVHDLDSLHVIAKCALIANKGWVYEYEKELGQAIRSKILQDFFVHDPCPLVTSALAEFADSYVMRSSAAFKLRQQYPEEYLEFFSEEDAADILTVDDYQEYLSSPDPKDYDLDAEG